MEEQEWLVHAPPLVVWGKSQKLFHDFLTLQENH
jgi:hypothetical protein|tara:strand:+ start:11121 stop:11222 length:102 start_codon:yes stop_codon:yes gene_type:complete